jgi:hypothetical protein
LVQLTGFLNTPRLKFDSLIVIIALFYFYKSVISGINLV